MDARSDFDDLVRLSFFTDIGKSIASATSINETFKVVMEHIGTVFAPLNWSLLLRDAKTSELVFSIVVGSASDSLPGKVLTPGKGIAGWIASNGQSLIIEDVSKDSRFDNTMDEITGFETKSIIGVPLKTRNKVFGVIELVNKLDGNSFTPLELKVLSTIADFAAIAIEKAYYLKALKRIATLDSLTGVNNRRSMMKILEHEKERCERYKSSLSLLIIDVDKFKSINDNFGHIAGDTVLKKLADILRNSIRKVDTLSRYGGDEFVIIMPDTESKAADEVRNRILKKVDDQNKTGEPAFTVSIGAFSAIPENIDDLFVKADKDLYRGKVEKDTADIANLSAHISDFFDEEEK